MNEGPLEYVDTSPKPDSHAEHLSNKRSAENVWAMPWQELAVVLGHQNILTHRNMNVAHRERSAEFLRHCGFDLTRFEHRKQVEQFFGEALFSFATLSSRLMSERVILCQAIFFISTTHAVSWCLRVNEFQDVAIFGCGHVRFLKS